MEIAEYTLPIRNLVDEARRVNLFLPRNPSVDMLAAAIAWRNVLHLRDKDVTLAAEGLSNSDNLQLPHLNKVQVPLPQPEMRIKVDLSLGGVARVNYQTQDDTLTFYLTPQGRPLGREQVSIEQSEAFADVVFTFGFHNNKKLGAYRDANLINIDTNIENTRFGKINLVDNGTSGFSELSARVLNKLNWPLESETATVLLGGIYAATSGFKQSVKPDTFECASLLTKADADVTLAGSLTDLHG